MDKAILVFAIVYVLKLEDGCYYIGLSHDVNRRLSQHYGGTGALWTRLHKPIEIEKIYFLNHGETDLENKITREYMNLYGEDKVKGGKYNNVKNVKLCRGCQTPMMDTTQYVYCMLCAKERGLIF